MEFEKMGFFNEINIAITVCNENFKIIYMNEKAIKTFQKYGDCIGKSLLNCHNENSIKVIKEMLSSGKQNIYTIKKDGIKKMIYQTPWFKDREISGLIEFSFEIPEKIRHFDRN